MAARLPAAPPALAGFSYVRPLGTGGFADVFLFQQDMPRRQVAVKVLLKDVVDADVIRMFNAEADVLASLSAHPSIVTIFQASISADGRPYLVMEHCPDSLSPRYRREILPVADVLALGVKIASAVETAHRSGLLHRDIKPSNLLLTSFGTPVLSDFGIAAALGPTQQDDVFAMSVPWSAPEVVAEQVTGSVASEVWGLGATVYSLLAGQSPFEHHDSARNAKDELKARIRKAHYTPIGRDDVPPALEDVLRRAMQKDPRNRQVSAGQFAYELQQVQHAMGLSVTPLEIASASLGGPVQLGDTSLRGATRSTVPGHRGRSARRGRATADRARDSTVVSASAPQRRRALLGAAIAAAALVVTASITAGILLLNGMW